MSRTFDPNYCTIKQARNYTLLAEKWLQIMVRKKKHVKRSSTC